MNAAEGDRSSGTTAGRTYDFATVDAGATRGLVAMMLATDAWPAVRDLRAWVLEQAAVGDGAIAVDAGCGPGTFGRSMSVAGPVVVDVDRSLAMLAEARRGNADARPVLADITRLPLRAGAARLVRTERVLQWTADPRAALAELGRVTAPDGWTAVTDTDWGSFALDHPDPRSRDRMCAAALGWVPHPRVARDLPQSLTALGATEVRVRTDTVVFIEWDPDDPAQVEGPPGLPLRTIAHAGPLADRAALEADVGVVADRARGGVFHAELVMVTALARWSTPWSAGGPG